jgi:16S rRNA (guanine(966)-N(2))-methyltransferase RsmD
MRVIGGEFRSRVLKTLPGMDVRPTPDRLRESLFSILAPRITGTVFADLYAGTGAVGIEALSRGAQRVLFVERSRGAIVVIRQNLKSLGIEERADVRQAKAAVLAKTMDADIVFLDPPYSLSQEYENTLAAMADRTADLVIVQHDLRIKLAESYGPLHQTRVLKQGDNCLTFYSRAATP